MKSKYRPKTKSVQKPSEPQVWCVQVTEHERYWGIRTDDLLEFPSEEKAVAYAESYNKKSAAMDTPDHFFQAIAFAKKQPQRNKDEFQRDFFCPVDP